MFSFFTKKKGSIVEQNSDDYSSNENSSKFANDDRNANSNVDIRESDFVDNSDPNEETKNNGNGVVTIHYGTGMPIDGIFVYIEKDREEEGMLDAMKNPDAGYMLQKVEIFKSTLKRRFELVRLRYEKDICNYTAQIENLQTLGLGGSQMQINAQVALCREHLAKIDSMEKRLDSGDPTMMTMIESYKRGFNIGVAVKVSEELK